MAGGAAVSALAALVAGAAALDYITGMLAAAKAGRLNSRGGLTGIYKKLSLFCALGLGFFLDAAIPVLAGRGLAAEISADLPFGLMIAAWVVLNESLSILENLAGCGVRLPGALAKALRAAGEKLDK